MEFKLKNPEDVSRGTQIKILKGFGIFFLLWFVWAMGGSDPGIEQDQRRLIKINQQINTLEIDRKEIEKKIEEFNDQIKQSYNATNPIDPVARAKHTNNSIIPTALAHNDIKPAVEELNLGKLAGAVALAETNDCKLGAGRYNNCFGIMQFGTDGSRWYKRYASTGESYSDFKRIWGKYYKKFPDYNLAHKYTGGDRTGSWLANVTKFYSEL